MGSILVIDDERNITNLIREALEMFGHNVEVAFDGREGIDKFGRDRFDMVITDIRMPDIDGPALFGWIEIHHPELATRTLFVTGDALGPGAGRFLAKSQRPVLEKPFAPADVVRLVSAFPVRPTTV